MKNYHATTKGYMLATLLGAIGGGMFVTLITRAIPKMMTRMMAGMMSNMMEQMQNCGFTPADM